MGKISELMDSVGQLFASRAKNHASASFWAKIAVVFLSAGVAGTQFWSAAGSAAPWSTANIVGISLAVGAGLITLYLSAFEKDSAEVIEDARKALVLAQDSENNYRAALRALDGYDLDQTRANELYNAIARMRDIVEAYLASPQIPLEGALQELIETARRPLTIALGFQLAEHYTICIYVAEKDDSMHGMVLRCVAHARTIDCSLDNARKWPLGVGVAGAALARGTDVIVPNLKAIELGSLYTEAQAKADDDDRYQSVAAVPVLLAKGDNPWGVVVGTSDRPGHFVSGAGISTVEAIRALAGMVALIVRAHKLGGNLPPTLQKPLSDLKK
jgi:hypothetical protein